MPVIVPQVRRCEVSPAAAPDQRCGQFKNFQILHVSPEPPQKRMRLTKWVRQEGKMLTLTVLKSVMLVAGLVAASMFLQAAMSYGKLPLVLGQ
jgi:hypothetical protein